jgi:O-antigen/teichoic acid export membrane protein
MATLHTKGKEQTVTPGFIEHQCESDAKAARPSPWKEVTALADRSPKFFSLCDQGVVSVTNFATGVIIGRVCGKAELGLYALAWTVLTLATAFSATLTTTPYTVFSPQLDRDQRSLYLGSILVHQFIVSTVFALAVAAVAALGSSTGLLSHSLSSVILITACVTVFVGLQEFARRVSFAELKVGLALLIDTIACMVQAGGLLLLFHFNLLTASRTYILFGISSATVASGWVAFHWKAIRFDARLCLQDVGRNWRFAKWVLGSSLLWTVAMYLYPWLLAAFHGISVTGLWAACSTIVAMSNPVSLGLSNYIGPVIHNVYATSGTAGLRRSVYRSSLLFMAVNLPLVLVLAGAGERIVTSVYGKAYAGSEGVVILLALNLLITALMYPYSRGLFSLDCARVDMYINVVAFTLMFTVGIAAVKYYAAFGAATALLVSSAVTAVVRFGVFAREVRQRGPSDPMDARPWQSNPPTDDGHKGAGGRLACPGKHFTECRLPRLYKHDRSH